MLAVAILCIFDNIRPNLAFRWFLRIPGCTLAFFFNSYSRRHFEARIPCRDPFCCGTGCRHHFSALAMSCSKLKRALAGDQSLWDEEEGCFAPHGGSRPSKQAKARVGGIRDRVQRAGLPTGPDCKEDLFDWPAFILSMVAKNPKRLERLIAIFVEGLRMASDYTGIDCPAEAERKRVVARKEQEEQSNKLREVREEAKKKAEEIKKKKKCTHQEDLACLWR